MEKAIIHLKVQYDGVNGTFRLLVPAFDALLDPGAIYDVSVPVQMHDQTDVEDLISTEIPSIAHA